MLVYAYVIIIEIFLANDQLLQEYVSSGHFTQPSSHNTPHLISYLSNFIIFYIKLIL